MKRVFLFGLLGLMISLAWWIWSRPGPTLSGGVHVMSVDEPVRVTPAPEQIAALAPIRLPAEQGAASVASVQPSYEGSDGLGLRLEFKNGLPAAEALVWFQVISFGQDAQRMQQLLHANLRNYVGVSDWAEYARRAKTPYRADADGRVRVPRPDDEFLLLAEHPEGRATWRDALAPDATELRLTLRPPDTHAILVQTRTGEPAADAPLAVRLAPEHDLDIVRTRSSIHGRVALDLDALGLAIPPAGRPNLSPPVVAIGAPFAADELQQLQVAVPVAGATLTLPATGSVEFLLPANVPEDTLLECWVERDDSTRAASIGCEKRLVRAGRVRLPYVGLGLRLRAQLSQPLGGNLGQIVLDGPTEEGQSLVVDWVEAMGGRRPAQEFVARLLDADGDPIADRSIPLLIRLRRPPHEAGTRQDPVAISVSDTPDARQMLFTDAEGRVRFTIAEDQPVQLYDLRFLVQQDGDAPTELRRTAVPPTEPQPIDLGDLVLEVPAVWLSGRVVDPAGKPIAHAQVHPGEWHRDFHRGAWTRIPGSGPDHPLPVESGLGGHFRIASKPGWLGGEPFVSVSADGFVRRTVDVSLGQEDVEIVLQPACKLQVLMQGDPSTTAGPRRGFSLTLRDPRQADWSSSVWRIHQTGEWTQDGLAAGPYQLELRDDLGHLLMDPVDVHVAPMPDGSPTTITIDVRGLLHTVRLRALQQGEVIPSSKLRVWSAEGAHTRVHKSLDDWIELQSGLKETVVLIESVEGAWFRGSLAAGSHEVELAPPGRLSLRVAPLPAEAAPLPLQLSLQAPGQGWRSAGEPILPDAQGLYHFAVPALPSFEVVGDFSPVPRMLRLERLRVEGVATVQLADVDPEGVAVVEFPPGPWLDALRETLERTRHLR